MNRQDFPQIQIQGRVCILGAGELATGVAVTLFSSGFRLIMTELDNPLAIRRTVAFAAVMHDGQAKVEGIQARHVRKAGFEEGMDFIPVLKSGSQIPHDLKPDILVDARMTKKKADDQRDLAELVIGLGPGFSAGENCHIVIETKRGHELGRIIRQGAAAPNTGIPGKLGGAAKDRLISSPGDGQIEWNAEFGDLVKKNQILGLLNGTQPVRAQVGGIVRGLIHPTVTVSAGMKIGDVDPRGAKVDIHHVSDKARSIGRAVLEAVLQERRRFR